MIIKCCDLLLLVKDFRYTLKEDDFLGVKGHSKVTVNQFVLGFKINLQKLKGASLLFLLILFSWVVSTSFSLVLLSEQLFVNFSPTFFFFRKRFSHLF